VVEYGKVSVVVDEARKVGAKIIASGESENGHDAVSSWLKEEAMGLYYFIPLSTQGYKLSSNSLRLIQGHTYRV
jgi:hypothetical protein